MRSFTLVVALAGIAGFGVAAACGDPYDGEIPAPGSEGGADVATDAIDDSATTTDAGIVEPDAPPPILDATSDKPAIDAAGCTCDCDKDGFVAMGQDAAACDASALMLDCDDLDPRAHPDAGFRKDLPTVDTLGDWNCDGVVNRELNVNVNCANLNGGIIGNNCTGAEGFTDDPPCGFESTYRTCATSNLTCVVASNEIRKQGCR